MIMQVRSLERQHQVATEGRNNAERAAVWRKGSSDGATRRGGGDPFQDAFNRLACVIDFQAQQQARDLLIEACDPSVQQGYLLR